MNNATVHLHTQHRIAPVDERIFGGFLEHMGRAVYEGIYDPGSPLSDERGFRTDVLEALRPLRMPVVRYPGGNFVSGYDWRHGVGPRADRPKRPDFAWHSIESNQFGTDEFMQWCDVVGTTPMMAVNLGTGTPADAAELLEYCNMPAGTSLADQRVANGRKDPYGVELWCLGNEMDGFWQAGHVPAETYAERALVASGLMKGLDPSIKTIACGSSTRLLPTYLEWDRKVLEYCWDSIDFLSVHRYSSNPRDDAASFLAEGVVIDQVLGEYRGLLSYVRGLKRSPHDVRLCFDEWNVWYRERSDDGGWKEAPHLLEEHYNLEDALVCAQYLNSFVRNADIVSIACIAQIVNVIAPILTRADGLLLQTIYWPFKLLRDAISGDALHVEVRAQELSTARRGDVPALDAAATFDDAQGTACISLVNRDHLDAVDVAIDVADAAFTLTTGQVLTGSVKERNEWDAPESIRPQPIEVRTGDDGVLHITLPAAAHAVVSLAAAPR